MAINLDIDLPELFYQVCGYRSYHNSRLIMVDRIEETLHCCIQVHDQLRDRLITIYVDDEKRETWIRLKYSDYIV